MKKALLLLLCVFCLSGCTNLPPENESLEKLKQVYDVIDNDCKTITILEKEAVTPYIEQIDDMDFPLSDGYRYVVAKLKDPEFLWRIQICTEENGDFIYRNMKYQIPVYETQDFILYQLPGTCDDYMIFEYVLEGSDKVEDNN